jgi:hypothetical protein
MSSKTVVIRGFVTTEEEYREAEKELEEQFGSLWVTMPEELKQRLIVNSIMLKLENQRLEKSGVKLK